MGRAREPREPLAGRRLRLRRRADATALGVAAGAGRLRQLRLRRRGLRHVAQRCHAGLERPRPPGAPRRRHPRVGHGGPPDPDHRGGRHARVPVLRRPPRGQRQRAGSRRRRALARQRRAPLPPLRFPRAGELRVERVRRAGGALPLPAVRRRRGLRS